MAKAAKTMPREDDNWVWMQNMGDKDRWSTISIPPGDLHAPYVKRMSKNSDGSWTFYVYRNMKCIGTVQHALTEKGLEAAQKLARVGKANPKVEAENKLLLAYVDGKEFTAEKFKALSELSQKGVANVYPWAMPSNRKLETAGVKKPMTNRTDLMNKVEKAAVKQGKWDMDAKIKIVKKGNPKKVGSKQFIRWELCIANDGKTVREMFAAGGDKYGLEAMLEAGYLELITK